MMDIDEQKPEQVLEEEEENDPFLQFSDYARSVLAPADEVDGDPDGNGAESAVPGWTWIVSRILRTCIAYSSGVTSAILLSDLSQAWNEQHRAGGRRKGQNV